MIQYYSIYCQDTYHVTNMEVLHGYLHQAPGWSHQAHRSEL